MITIGATIKQRRLKMRMSQATLAKQLNVRAENIQNWEHSRTIPHICRLSKIIDFLGFDLLEIVKKAD